MSQQQRASVHSWHLLPQVVPYSQLGTPTERRAWWAPVGWVLVALCMR
ncbi:hypothetical protein [Leekyejoonella antrihumi]|nr:hypothetical protein [Leekyejoonella antrihumi]